MSTDLHSHATAPAEPATREPLGPRFRALLTSTGMANLADGVVQVGLPLYAVTLTRSPVQISLLSAAAWLPWLLLALVGGAAVDRSDRRTVQVAALAVRAALLLAGAVAVTTGRMTVEVLIALALLYGATDVMIDLAETALVPDVTPRSRLRAAYGRIQATQMVMAAFVGAPIAGLLLGFGAAQLLGTAAALAGLGALVLALGVRGDYGRAGDPPPGTTHGLVATLRSTVGDVRQGLATLVHHPVLRPLTLAGALFNMASTGYTALLVLWAVGAGSRIGLTPGQYVWIGVAQAVGAVIGATAVERVVRRVPELHAMVTGWWAAAACLLAPVLAPRPWVLFAAVLVVGAGAAASNVLSVTVRQRLVQPGMLGRVTGASRTLGYGLMPLGALLAGAAADRWGLGPVLLAACALMLATPLLPALAVRRDMLVDADA
ncbi:MFS transporter [Isoptericola sp. b441]|uniref:MFS transporter n=1 Tax=Actinotalea lenta TaxID=3064654 RepID=A0ABT9DAE3_9CELL|nr:MULTISPECIES: MFS transporter [unclassified Isoptericola]MDO8105912.1 MFS transporter [Isoptericola sp. b441]MDO8122627.1 MFS transporter [Isoptericola sp. b490]